MINNVTEALTVIRQRGIEFSHSFRLHSPAMAFLFPVIRDEGDDENRLRPGMR